MKKYLKITSIALCISTILCGTALAANTPAIRLSAPANAKAGETITINIVAEISPQDAIKAYAATLKWKPAQITATAAPELANATLSEKLALKYDNTKGISEIAAATMNNSLKVTTQGKITLANQNFRLAKNLKSGDTVKIGFSTDPKISACGTSYSEGNGTKEYKIITGAIITIK